MQIQQNISLSGYSTMRLGGTAAFLAEITDRSEIAGALNWAREHQLPVIMIGVGSNIVWKDEGFPGLVLVNRIRRYEVQEIDSENVYVTIGAGENWDEMVGKTVSEGLSGIEQLSLIPGTAGATPVQNVGAYGREIAEVLVTVEAFDTQVNQLVNLPGADCAFGYRTSRFKTTDKDRFMISAITLHLTRSQPQPPFYDSLQRYLRENDITSYTPQTIRQAVIAIRSAKLPDPAETPNNGSFFHNPMVDRALLTQLLADYPTIRYWEVDNENVKVSAAWLIEQTGFANFFDEATGMATWPAQPLVFVNRGAKTTAQLIAFRDKVAQAVQTKFGISLQQEPELLP